MIATSGKSNKHVLYNGIKGELDSNMAIFINIIPYEAESGKGGIGNEPASTKLLSISPLILVAPGDFLSIFLETPIFRFELVKSHPGAYPGLWLDYSEISGKLNHMRVAKPGESTNVCLA